MGVPISLFFAWATFYGGTNRWDFFGVVILVTWSVSLGLALGIWYFLVRPGQGIAELPSHRLESELGDAIEYLAHYDESDTRIAERTFVRRGFRELWLLEALLGPVSAAFVLAILYQAGARTGYLLAFGALGCLLIVWPAILLVARPAWAAAGARRQPNASIAFRAEGLVIRASTHDRIYEWRTIRGIWDVGPHYVLVAGKHSGIHLPKEGLPAGALDCVRGRAALDDPVRH